MSWRDPAFRPTGRTFDPLVNGSAAATPGSIKTPLSSPPQNSCALSSRIANITDRCHQFNRTTNERHKSTLRAGENQ